MQNYVIFFIFRAPLCSIITPSVQPFGPLCNVITRTVHPFNAHTYTKYVHNVRTKFIYVRNVRTNCTYLLHTYSRYGHNIVTLTVKPFGHLCNIIRPSVQPISILYLLEYQIGWTEREMIPNYFFIYGYLLSFTKAEISPKY